jgi:hypothetical protein
MSTHHTLGPWGRNIKPASRYPVIFAGRNTHVAQVITKGLPESECEANADLIAAAPELLAALRRIASACLLPESNGVTLTPEAMLTAIGKVAQVAVNKADGAT